MAHEKRTDLDTDFEASLKALQKLVDTLEQGDVPLEELVAKFGEGHALLKRCQQQLQNAQLKVEQLRQQDAVPSALDEEAS